MASLAAWAIRAARAGRGRWVAMLVLLLVSLPLAFPDAFRPVQRLRLAWLDFYQQAVPRERGSDAVVIVAIDEPSLRALGQWPWPRTRLAALIERIGTSGARAIGLDIVMPEADQTSPEALIPHLDPAHTELIEALAALPTHDARLTAAIERHPVVLGIAGSEVAAPAQNSVVLTKTPVQLLGEAAELPLQLYPHKLASLPRFQRVASGQGIINAVLERGVVRRMPLVSTDGVALLPAFGLELVRVANGASGVNVVLQDGAVTSIAAGTVEVPTQPEGHMWIHFNAHDPGRYVSALEVLAGEPKAVARLKDKIVIVGLTGLALVDRRVTPLSETIPGTEVHAQMIESMLERRFLQRPGWMPAAETVALLVLGAILIWAVPRMQRGGAMFLLAASIMLALALGFGLFISSGLLFDAASPTVALLAVFASLMVSALVLADHDRRMSQRSLRAEREKAARVAFELEAARRIQLGILPRSEASFPDERRFELAAAIEPARIVGGDLYDFFMLDADRLFFHVADVSGKGIPASLFMSITKVLTKSVALRSDRDAEDLLTQTNKELARDNPEFLFVTAFAAILEANTGTLTYWTAGHETPFVYDGVDARQLDRSRSGPPLCALASYQYPQTQYRLRPGETLVLFTDGVSEAENPAGLLYGKERIAQCLQRLPAGASAADILSALRADVDAFVAGAPASDDLTLLALRWLGPSAARDAGARALSAR